MSARHAAPEERGTGSRLVAAGALLFLVGAVSVVVAVVPVLVDPEQTANDVATYLAGVLLPLGLAVALLGLLRGARSRRRAARRSSNRS